MIHVESKDYGSYTEVIAMGDITFGNWEKVTKEAEAVITDGATVLILNWIDVGYFDSSGLQALVAIFNQSKKHPGMKFALVTDKQDHLKIFKLISFDKLFHIYPSVQEALVGIS